MSKQKIIIVGGGFGGTKVALELSQHSKFDITLISDHADFRYYPSLYRTATGGRRYISSVPLGEVFKDKSVEVIVDAVTGLNRTKKTVTLKDKRELPYDNLVLAMGVQTNYFGIKGLQEFSYGIKNIDEAVRFKRHLHQQVTEDKRLDLNYIVIGGGPTGLELAGALPAYLKIIANNHNIKRPRIHVSLVEAAPSLVPRMPKDIGKHVAKHLRKLGIRLYLDTTVEAATAETLKLEDRVLKSETVIWTAGVTNHPFFSQNKFQINSRGKVRVDQFLQAEPNIYVIGDNADTPYSGMAQTALNDGKYLAENLVRQANQQDPEPYEAKKPIYVLPAGPKWAAVLWGNMRIYGRAGYALRRAADLLAYHDYEPWQLATRRWVAEDDSEEDCRICNN